MPIPSDERTKLDAKSKKSIFLGYPKGANGYMLWDPESKKKVISRDVVFDEASMLKKERLTKLSMNIKMRGQAFRWS